METVEDVYTLLYQDTQKMVLMEMKHYPGNGKTGGIARLSQPGQEVRVSARERGYLLKLKNGNRPLFIEKT